MTGTENVTVIVAFSAGLITFLSPCILPIFPSYLAYITGISIDELSHEKNSRRARKTVITNSLLFILGFSIIFVLMGISATFIGRFLSENIRWIEIFGGIIVIILGLHFAGIFRLKFLDHEKRIHLQEKPLGFLGTVFVGMAFGAGWTPCVGPMLGAILAVAASTQDIFKGVIILISYSVGLGIPFFISALLVHKFFAHFGKINKYFKIISMIGGGLLIIIGLLLITGYFSSIVSYFSREM
jgi:cytochrome c-type biogenesis protein